MKFYEVVNQVVALLQREGRVSYRALRLEFDLNDDALEALKEELIEVKELAVDKDGKMLVWVGGEAEGEKAKRGNGETENKGRASNVQRLTSKDQPPAPSTQPLTLSTHAEAEACFHKAIDIAQKQQAKSWELRASTSLARLWQSQGKHHAARNMLSEIYNWFTEGFDTKDLQEAKALIEELSH